MKVTAYTTRKVVKGENLFKLLDDYLPRLAERSVVVITSKVVAICEGRMVEKGVGVDKEKLALEEAELYLPPQKSKYNVSLAVKESILIATAGIDESNGNGYYILWPKDSYAWAEKVWKYLQKRFGLKQVGVIISDSKTTPLRWGTTGVGIAFSGFEPLNSYIGKPDIFGMRLRMTKASMLDGLAGAAVLVMGEGSEQTPLAVIEDLPFVKFKAGGVSAEEQKALRIGLKDDLYAPLLEKVDWKKR